jgi:hypothetical protein
MLDDMGLNFGMTLNLFGTGEKHSTINNDNYHHHLVEQQQPTAIIDDDNKQSEYMTSSCLESLLRVSDEYQLHFEINREVIELYTSSLRPLLSFLFCRSFFLSARMLIRDP